MSRSAKKTKRMRYRQALDRFAPEGCTDLILDDAQDIEDYVNWMKDQQIRRDIQVRELLKIISDDRGRPETLDSLNLTNLSIEGHTAILPISKPKLDILSMLIAPTKPTTRRKRY